MSKLCRRLLLAIGIVVGTAAVTVGQTFTTLVNFSGINGSGPSLMSMVQGVDGSLYGTTTGGGASSNGTVFKLSKEAKLRTLYSFCSQAAVRTAIIPIPALLWLPMANLYGTTKFGGEFTCTFYGTCGTIFKITPTGSFTTLFSFDEADGELPIANMTQAQGGELFGTTSLGGSGGCDLGCGTIFKIATEGTLLTLYNFDHLDGQGPFAGLAQSMDGNFYGTTYAGGTYGAGTVFSMTPQGVLSTLHDFGAVGDGSYPYAGLVASLDGNFYGATIDGGASKWGVIFRIASSEDFTILHSFGLSDGGQPYSLMQGTDGNFYGTTNYGGNLSCRPPFGCGTVFQITPSGTLTTLHAFALSDGAYPTGGLIQATNGTFFGSTSAGGKFSGGTLFSLNVGLGPFVALVRGAARASQHFGILGQGLTNTSAVSLNGLATPFTVKSDTLIEASVPAGATTGYVTVTTPSGTLTSNKPFVVIP